MFHLIDVSDSEMCSLAQFIHSLGYKVECSGNITLLKNKDIKVKRFSKNNITDDMFIIISDNLENDNEELVRARELNLRIYTCSQMKKRFTGMFETIAVSGCVGKDITTLMMTYVLSYVAGCNYLLEDGKGYASKENKYLCLEADENKRNFLNINPYYTVITNIDLNYPDYYKSIDEVILAYQEFASKTEKMVLANGDDRYTRLLNLNVPVFYYGLNNDNDIVAKEVEYTKNGTNFEVHVEGNYYGNFELPIYGKAMLLNTLAVIGMCHYERIEFKDVAKALKEFFINNKVYNEKHLQDLVLVNSEFNHPLEIKNIIKAYRQKYPENSIEVVFNPYELFQEEVFKNRLTEYINLSDKAYITGVSNLKENDNLKDINNKESMLTTSIRKVTKQKNLTLLFLSNKHPNTIQLEIEEDIKKNRKAL